MHLTSDQMKHSLFHYIDTDRMSSTRLLISLSSCFNFYVLYTGVSQAYLQGYDKLEREIFILSPSDLNLGENIL